MDLIILGGNSVDNVKWIEKIEILLKPYFRSTQIQYYEHWKSDLELINLDKEIEKLIENTKSKEQYIVLAKSVGTLVTSKAIFEQKISPIRCFFMGIPINWAYKYNFDIDNWFKNFKPSLTIIQHTNDPITPAQELRNFLKDENAIDYNFIELPGNDHYYQELNKIADLVKNSI